MANTKKGIGDKSMPMAFLKLKKFNLVVFPNSWYILKLDFLKGPGPSIESKMLISYWLEQLASLASPSRQLALKVKLYPTRTYQV